MKSPKRVTLPHSRIFKYKKDPDSLKYFQTSGDIGFTNVPQELSLESIRHPETIRAETFIRGKEREGGRYKFQTGLRPVSPQLYYGDHYRIVKGKKVNSFILIQFSACQSELTMHYFNNYKVFPRYRAIFIANYFRSN
jgi:hypothetical protein